MPEGDTVWRTAQRLNLALAGQPLTRLELRWGDLGGRDLLPARTQDVVSRGKHLLHRLDTGVTVHTHLKMEGSWHVLHTTRVTDAALRDHQLRAVVQTPTWTALGLRLGLVEVWPTDQEDRHLGHLGPNLLGPDWDLATAVGNVRAAREGDRSEPATIGAALLDQRNLAGIGTMWAAEGLIMQGIHPWTPAAEVSEPVVTDLIASIRRLMRQAAASATQTSTGRTKPGDTTYAHGRLGRPCRRCGDTVRIAPIGPPLRQRSMFYCPGCQGGLAPSDSGASIAPLRRTGSRRSTWRPATAGD